MKTYAILNQKGGVGKTTTAIELGASIFRRGHRLLFIDADSQGDASDTANVKIDGAVTLYDVILAEDKDLASIKDAVQKTKFGDFVAGDPLLVEASRVFILDEIEQKNLKPADRKTPRIFKLKEELEKCADQYDYAIIDCGPKMDDLMDCVMIAADEIIIPLHAERYSLKGLVTMIEKVEEVRRKYKTDIKIAGILITHLDGRPLSRRAVKKSIHKVGESQNLRVFKTAIPECCRVGEAQLEKTSIFDYMSKSTASIAYEKFTDELLGEKS